MATQTMDEKLDNILEIVTFIKDSSVHKDDFNKHVKKTDTQMTEIKKDITGLKKDVADLKTDVIDLKEDVADLKTDVIDLKEDVADLKEDTNHIKNHVKCLRFAVEKSVEILSDKKVYNEKEKQAIMEQLVIATI